MKTEFVYICIFLLGCVLLCESADAEVPDLLIWHRDAIGTVEAFEALTMMATETTLSMLVLEGATESVSVVPDKTWTSLETPVISFTDASNGLIRWRLDQNRQFTVRDNTHRLQRYAPVLPEYQYLFPNDEIHVTDAGIEVLDDIECRILTIKAPGYRKPRKLFLDPGTWLCIREETEQEGIPIALTYSDFRTIHGLAIPHGIVQQVLMPGMPPSTLTITGIRINEPVQLNLFEPPAADMHDFEFPDEHRVTIPMKVHGEHLMVEIAINDSEPEWFILDSGAAATIMDCSYADMLNLERTGGMHALGVGGAESIDRVVVDTLSTGEFSIRALNLYCMDLGLITDKLGLKNVVKGIVGYDLFARTVMRLDYAGEKLTLFHPDSFVYDGPGTATRGDIINNLIYVDGVVDGDIEGKLRIDTGAAGGLHLHAGYLRKKDVFDRFEGYRRVEMHGAGGAMELQLVKVTSVTIGGYDVANPVSTLNTGDTFSILDTLDAVATVGNQVLSQFVVTFDFPNSRLILEPVDTHSMKDHMHVNRAGMHVADTDTGAVTVITIIEGSPAEKAGLKEGDQLVRIEKLSSGKGLDAETVNRMMHGKALYRLQVLRHGKTLRFRLDLAAAD